jgi:hypothetical protein
MTPASSKITESERGYTLFRFRITNYWSQMYTYGVAGFDSDGTYTDIWTNKPNAYEFSLFAIDNATNSIHRPGVEFPIEGAFGVGQKIDFDLITTNEPSVLSQYGNGNVVFGDTPQFFFRWNVTNGFRYVP